jgi:hypothetical protein
MPPLATWETQVRVALCSPGLEAAAVAHPTTGRRTVEAMHATKGESDE